MSNWCLIVDSEPTHAEALRDFCEKAGLQVAVTESSAAARDLIAGTLFDVAFIDLDLADGDGLRLLAESRLEAAEIMTMGDRDDPARADEAVRRGASYFFCKPFDPDYLSPVLRDIATDEPGAVSGSHVADSSCVVDQFGYLRGSSPRMRKLYRLLRKVAPTDAALLLIGESGTGKELLARTVHTFSSRADKPFIAFNCASVAESLVESELFGHERGSFSGADKRHRGFFERAAGGTLLLDEITEMNQEMQTRLLRVLEEKRLRRVGSETDIGVDVRIISATNRSPEEAVEEGVLREDLYYRLAQFPLHLPPLRERGEDIAGLAKYFLNELNIRHGTELKFSVGALDAISGYRWPGNVRQLKYAVERAYIVSEAVIEREMLPDPELEEGTGWGSDDSIRVQVGDTLADSERKIILATLERNEGDKKRTASELGISLKTLYNRLNEYETPSADRR
ncbi:MAG: sigma-54 dependent transcriptional regulator [Halioglobus sp.]